MKKLWKVIILTAVMVMSISGMASAAITKNTDVTSAGSGCQMVGIEGQYIAECKAALDRLNDIRLEACEEGVINPATGRALKKSDYTPLKWSSDMEYIARIRAAESSVTMDHVRTNGKNCFAIKSPNGIGASSEVIAWNYSASMVKSIAQWYAEKKAWVNKTGAVTGHYEAIIDTTNKYVGLGTFYSEKTRYYNTTVGEFSSTTKNLSQTMGTSEAGLIQALEVRTTTINSNKDVFVAVKLATPAPATTPATTKTVTPAPTQDTTAVKTASAVKTVKIKVNKTKVTLKKGKKETLKVTVTPTGSTEKVTFKSSDKNIVKVTSKGVIKGVKKGTATITIKSGNAKATVKVTVK